MIIQPMKRAGQKPWSARFCFSAWPIPDPTAGGNADFVDCANNGKLTCSSTDTVNTADLCAGDYR